MGIFDDDECWMCKNKPKYFSTDKRQLCEHHWWEARRSDIVCIRIDPTWTGYKNLGDL